ncbi:MAG TPA: TIGR02285 family protein [Magnetospirillaceae bacterium]|nr:TIGR02285 family protein [Magnetospirillaceae bacterium]
MRRLAALLLMFAAHAGAAPAEDVLWFLPEFPPVFITGNALQGQGYGDGELRYLTGHLPQFHHRIIYATAPRLWHEMETRDGVCVISVAKLPEREKFALFSARPVYGATNEILVRTDHLGEFEAFLDGNGHIDLARLSADGHLRGGYSDGVTYGPAIDDFIRDPQRKTPLEVIAHMRAPLPLLDKGRLDFVFGYFMEMAYYRRTHDMAAAFTALPTTPEPVRQDSYVACSKGPLGSKIIAAIDTLLASDESMAEYVENLRGWYSPAEFEIAQKLARSTGH